MTTTRQPRLLCPHLPRRGGGGREVQDGRGRVGTDIPCSGQARTQAREGRRTSGGVLSLLLLSLGSGGGSSGSRSTNIHNVKERLVRRIITNLGSAWCYSRACTRLSLRQNPLLWGRGGWRGGSRALHGSARPLSSRASGSRCSGFTASRFRVGI